jgi:hypothetical protein
MDSIRRLPAQQAAELAAGLAILLFAWLGLQVHDSIAGLGDMAKGIKETGTEIERSGAVTSKEIRSGVGDAASAIGALPIVGGQAAATLRRTADNTAAAVEKESRASGRRLVLAGAQGEEDARDTAALVGWLAFLIPTVLLLAQILPRRLKPWWEAGHLSARS